MNITVVVPQIGQSIAEATIVKWYKKPGEKIEKGETLVEIGTDKVNTEIPAPETGVVEKLLVQEGQTVPVHTEIAVLSGEGEVRTERKREEAKAGEFASVTTTRQEKPVSVFSPYVRKLVREHNLDLSTVQGTGEGGRVTKEDILRIIKVREKVEPVVERVTMSRMRKLIAENMVLSKRTTAELTAFFEVNMTGVAEQRERAKEIYRTQHGIPLTYLHFVLYAAAKALRAFPIVNSSIEGDTILYRKEVHIGMAVALEDGLIVPVIRNADQKNLFELARAAHGLSEAARLKHLSPDDLQGGTFTITNPGVFGALMGTPIILQPQVAILGLGAVVKRPVVINDAVTICPMAYLSLTYDHRAMDGSTADQFLAHIKNTLEKECPSPLD